MKQKYKGKKKEEEGEIKRRNMFSLATLTTHKRLARVFEW